MPWICQMCSEPIEDDGATDCGKCGTLREESLELTPAKWPPYSSLSSMVTTSLSILTFATVAVLGLAGIRSFVGWIWPVVGTVAVVGGVGLWAYDRHYSTHARSLRRPLGTRLMAACAYAYILLWVAASPLVPIQSATALTGVISEPAFLGYAGVVLAGGLLAAAVNILDL